MGGESWRAALLTGRGDRGPPGEARGGVPDERSGTGRSQASCTGCLDYLQE